MTNYLRLEIQKILMRECENISGEDAARARDLIAKAVDHQAAAAIAGALNLGEMLKAFDLEIKPKSFDGHSFHSSEAGA